MYISKTQIKFIHIILKCSKPVGFLLKSNCIIRRIRYQNSSVVIVCLKTKPTNQNLLSSISLFSLPQNQIKGGTHQLFQQLSKCLRLTVVQEVLFALALRHSVDSEIAAVAETHLRTVLPALVQSYVDTEGGVGGGGGGRHEGALHDTTPEILHLILSVILNNPKEVSY